VEQPSGGAWEKGGGSCQEWFEQERGKEASKNSKAMPGIAKKYLVMAISFVPDQVCRALSFFLSPKIPKIFCKGLFFFSLALVPVADGVPSCAAAFLSGCSAVEFGSPGDCGDFDEPPPNICERKDPTAEAGHVHREAHTTGWARSLVT